MKKIFLGVAAIAVMAMGSATLSSCKEEQHATEICLPDSAQVGKNLPVVDGTLAEYYSVIPQAYRIDLADSVLTLRVKVRHDKTYVPNRYVSATIGNPDSLLSKYPYLVLVDSVGAPVQGFRMDVDTTVVSQLDALMKGEPGMETELTFTSPAALTVEQKDSLAAVSRNFKLVANLLAEVDAETVEQLLGQYRRAVGELNNWASGFGSTAPVGMGAQIAMSLISKEKSMAKTVESIKSFMTPEQIEEYNKIRATRTKVGWAR